MVGFEPMIVAWEVSVENMWPQREVGRICLELDAVHKHKVAADVSMEQGTSLYMTSLRSRETTEM